MSRPWYQSIHLPRSPTSDRLQKREFHCSRRSFLTVSSSLKVVSTFHFSPASQQVLREAAASSDVTCVTNADELFAHLHDAEVLCAYNMPPNWRVLAPRLRWLQYPGAGVDALQPTGLLNADSGVMV